MLRQLSLLALLGAFASPAVAQQIAAPALPVENRSPDLINQLHQREWVRLSDDGFVRETFVLPRHDARLKAREILSQYPKQAYWTEIESWAERPGDEIEFTMRWLKSAD